MLSLRSVSLLFLLPTYDDVVAFRNSLVTVHGDAHCLFMTTPTDVMSTAVSEALGKPVTLVPTRGGGGSGGGGATTSAMVDKETGNKYFIKSARNKLDMLMAEYLGVKAMSETNTIQVPTPVAFGEHEPTKQAFAIFEFLEFCSGGNQFELGVRLAKVGLTLVVQHDVVLM